MCLLTYCLALAFRSSSWRVLLYDMTWILLNVDANRRRCSHRFYYGSIFICWICSVSFQNGYKCCSVSICAGDYCIIDFLLLTYETCCLLSEVAFVQCASLCESLFSEKFFKCLCITLLDRVCIVGLWHRRILLQNPFYIACEHVFPVGC